MEIPKSKGENEFQSSHDPKGCVHKVGSVMCVSPQINKVLSIVYLILQFLHFVYICVCSIVTYFSFSLGESVPQTMKLLKNMLGH